MNLRIQAAVATKEANQYKVVFQSGEGFADFAAQIKTVLHKRCWGYTTHIRDEFSDRGLTQDEINTLNAAIRNKIGTNI